MGMVFGLAMTAVALVAVLGTPRIRPAKAIEAADIEHTPHDFFWNTRQAISHASFRMLLFSFSLVVMGLAVNSSLLLHFLKYYVVT